jgi:hypothetical protein
MEVTSTSLPKGSAEATVGRRLAHGAGSDGSGGQIAGERR